MLKKLSDPEVLEREAIKEQIRRTPEIMEDPITYPADDDDENAEFEDDKIIPFGPQDDDLVKKVV